MSGEYMETESRSGPGRIVERRSTSRLSVVGRTNLSSGAGGRTEPFYTWPTSIVSGIVVMRSA